MITTTVPMSRHEAVRPRGLREAAAFYVAFGAVAAAVLVLGPGPFGVRLLALVAVWHVAFPLLGRWRGRTTWVRLWAFLVPLSLFQIGPDAFLADVLGTLRFTDVGGPHVGPVPLALGGMWAVALWASTFAGLRTRSAAVAAVVAGFVFVASEFVFGTGALWRAVGVADGAGVAAYVVVPEILLGAATYVAFVWASGRPWWQQVGAAAAVSVFYLGALAASYGLLDRVLA
jgi:hypothetical protein